jgi:hypothetical protein
MKSGGGFLVCRLSRTPLSLDGDVGRLHSGADLPAAGNIAAVRRTQETGGTFPPPVSQANLARLPTASAIGTRPRSGARVCGFNSASMEAEREARELAGHLSQHLLELPEFAPLGWFAYDRVPFVQVLGKLVNPQAYLVARPRAPLFAPLYAFSSIHQSLHCSVLRGLESPIGRNGEIADWCPLRNWHLRDFQMTFAAGNSLRYAVRSRSNFQANPIS